MVSIISIFRSAFLISLPSHPLLSKFQSVTVLQIYAWPKFVFYAKSAFYFKGGSLPVFFKLNGHQNFYRNKTLNAFSHKDPLCS